MSSLRLGLLFVDLMLTAAIAGFFYAYSSSAIRGLDVVDAAAAIEAMNGINAEIRNLVFAPAFFGPVIVGVILIALLLPAIGSLAAWLVIAGVGLYAAGGMGVTFLVHVPMNEALGVVVIPPDASTQAEIWRAYSSRWTLWNHVRTGFRSLPWPAWWVLFA